MGVTGLERFRGKEEIKGRSGRERTSRVDAKESKERTWRMEGVGRGREEQRIKEKEKGKTCYGN